MWGRVNWGKEVGMMEVGMMEVKVREVRELEVKAPKEVGGRVDGKPTGRNSRSR